MKALKLIASLAILVMVQNSHASIVIPGADGSDGVLNITGNTVIDLSQAVTTNWDANNSANAGKGVYDSNQWAVVFKYSSVNIASGATVTFNNHPSRAPVVWLVNGNVTNNGTIALDGQGGLTPPALSEPGPGGFRGGIGNYSSGVLSSAGFGPGGGNTVTVSCGSRYGAGGSYGSAGAQPFSMTAITYGNPSLIPLIGGSGGGGTSDAGAGAGAGCILIASANSFYISGMIRANGGSGVFGRDCGGSVYYSGGGSGGGIRLVAETFVGNGVVQALGGGGTSGGLGRVRIERVVNNNTISVTPDPSVVDLPPGSTALIWPPTNAPQLRIVSIGGTNAPADPRSGFGTTRADIVQPLTGSVAVVIETTNVEQASQVFVRGIPRSNGAFTEFGASVSSVISTNPLVVRWTATLPVNVGYSAVQVRAVRP